jgi:DNA-directed RNA polymerase
MSYQEVRGVEVLAQMTRLYRSEHEGNLHTKYASFTVMMRSPWNISSPVFSMRTLAF